MAEVAEWSRSLAYDVVFVESFLNIGSRLPVLSKYERNHKFKSIELDNGAVLEHNLVFYGVNSKSECLLVRIARGCNLVADAWIYLKLANGKTYSLSESMGYQQSSDGKCQTFSCGKLQMHYLCPMRRWRIFFCGMLNEIVDGEKDVEDPVFVKLVFLWKAASDVYDCTLDTNPKGFASAMAKSGWKTPLKPPVKT
ncbi:putative phosphoenolpyruvate synthase, partial [Nephila pilipes]